MGRYYFIFYAGLTESNNINGKINQLPNENANLKHSKHDKINNRRIALRIKKKNRFCRTNDKRLTRKQRFSVLGKNIVIKSYYYIILYAPSFFNPIQQRKCTLTCQNTEKFMFFFSKLNYLIKVCT